ncbi:hypothetical protein KY316_03000 [Candidatus Woesearchaeota archaeon]|nr:hypothetical protein [Candidatus Woesearchaeota archaeon]
MSAKKKSGKPARIVVINDQSAIIPLLDIERFPLYTKLLERIDRNSVKALHDFLYDKGFRHIYMTGFPVKQNLLDMESGRTSIMLFAVGGEFQVSGLAEKLSAISASETYLYTGNCKFHVGCSAPRQWTTEFRVDHYFYLTRYFANKSEQPTVQQASPISLDLAVDTEFWAYMNRK